ncbi:MAG TPA: polyprenyl synthetase family protein [Clostridia bacterium]|nr:polyprenyl synthetase family protein [Clostridia bacterium]
MTFEKKFDEFVDEINENLDKLVVEKDNLQKDIYTAMRYSLLAGGKRIRPVILLACAEILDIDKDTVMPFACAIEMIHTYSLIHDDLPALDNDELRRGRNTCHIEFSEALAILAGDALLNKAFEVMSKKAIDMEHPTRGLRMLHQVSVMSGTEGMIGGQIIDIQSEGKEVSKEVLETMYKGKTGCLLKAPVLVALEAANCMEDENAEILINYVETIGVAFQIKDDILDSIGDEKTLGKNTGRDVEKNKTTFVTIYGLEYCEELLEELTHKAIGYAEKLGEKGKFLKELAVYLLKREN